MAVSWDIESCCLIAINRRFRGAYCLNHQVMNEVITQMMEAVSSSETGINIYQTASCQTPEDCHFHTRHRDNLKSHNVVL
jgi:hypothetical protein